MKTISNQIEYEAILSRVEELTELVDDNTPTTDRNYVELDLLADLVVAYEKERYAIKSPSLVDVIKLRMYEMGINQTSLSKCLRISPSRVSDYLSGRSEPTLRVARDISRTLNIDAGIVLGV